MLRTCCLALLLLLPSLLLAADDGGDTEGSMLKQAFDLKLQLGDSGLAILDARSAEDYAKGHIPHAVHVDVDAWKTKSLSKGGLYDEKYWGETLGKLGIDNTKQVVVYGDSLPSVARAWWLLKYLGVEHASILDGGFKNWVAQDYSVVDAAAEVEPAKFVVKLQPDRLMELDDLMQKQRKQEAKILDTRSADEYREHIPGAVNVEWKELVDKDGKFKKPEELKVLLGDKGIGYDSEVITHCQSGGRAAVAAFALELAGYPKVKNYYCGWSEYSKKKGE